jgi:hypothetical protein
MLKVRKINFFIRSPAACRVTSEAPDGNQDSGMLACHGTRIRE